jgi:uncharacterized membrane protein YcfT
MPVTGDDRSRWVDIGKGLSILLVVFHHSSHFFTPQMLIVDQVLIFFRMPLFFFASGLFLAKMMRYDLSKLLARRLAPLLYLYIFWSVLKWALVSGIPHLRGAAVDSSSILYLAWEPQATLWFIYALAIYSLIAWLLRSLPVSLVALGALVSCGIAFSVGPVTDGPFGLRIARFFLWFWLGYALRDRASALVRSGFRRPMLLAVPAWSAFCLCLTASGADLHAWAVPLTATALVAGLILAGALERTMLSAPLSALGRNTLPIYVAHFVPLMILSSHLFAGYLRPSWSAALLAVVVAVIATLCAKAVADRIGLRWLYEMPHGLRESLQVRLHAILARQTTRPATGTNPEIS